jgi:hypothetical protein
VQLVYGPAFSQRESGILHVSQVFTGWTMRICVLVLGIWVATLPIFAQQAAPPVAPPAQQPAPTPAEPLCVFEPDVCRELESVEQENASKEPPAKTTPPKKSDQDGPSPKNGSSSNPSDSAAVVQRGRTDSIQDQIGDGVEGDTLPRTDLQALVEKWTNWSEWNKTDPAKRTVGDLRALDTIETFGDPLCKAKTDKIKLCAFTAGFYVIHIIGAEGTAKDPYSVKVASSVWYLYESHLQKPKQVVLKRVVAVDGKFPDIFNVRTGILIALQILHQPSCSAFDASCANDVSAKYDLTVTQKTAANTAALTGLINGLLGTVKPSAGRVPNVASVVVLPPEYVATASVYGLGQGAPRPPFDWKITANVTGSPTGNGSCSNLTKSTNCSFTHTLSVVGPQYWNVGIDITPRGPRENKYALSSSNIVTQSHTIHSPLFVALDFSPWAQWGYRPYFQAGIPLSGAAFHLPFVSMAEPLPFTKKWLQISVYCGVVFMQQTFPRTLAVGVTTNTAAFNADLVTDRALKPLFGIEVPVSSIISKVKSSVGTGK